MAFLTILTLMEDNYRIFTSLLIAILLIIIFNFIVKRITTRLLKKAKSKVQKSNIKIFSRILSVTFVIVTLFITFFSYMGSWTGLGIIAGLVTAGLSFALQRPITGIAAWIMIIVKRPFQVGDRICIGDVKGEVYDITLTHVYLDEVGGNIQSSMKSGRNVMVPNYLLFEQNIINYTLTDDYVLEEINFEVTYESDLDKALEIAKKAAIKYIEKFATKEKWKPVYRVKMEASSMKIKILFYAPILEIYQIASDVTKEIYDLVKKDKNVEIAYPHMELVMKDKKLFKK
ncbi:MAG: mechanosensitive ion channel family protein [Nanoarchaeota archaeon]|nr:mechanosensitive ion channel family protein [Nanoarchaeota archaeon]MBU4116399.1 mechanosensitive ion channel family protein [Nanoarchaeota archaeon]